MGAADEVIFFIPRLPDKELANVRKMAGVWGYKIKSFAHSVEELEKQILSEKPFLLLLWDDTSLEHCKDDFYNLMIRFQQQFYLFGKGEMHYPTGNCFMTDYHVNRLIGENKPPQYYRI
ncbi:hypothetical protein [Paenibacillus sp. SN-8-1]|uniref:hypothetical protein n=1 Tax=Paenibacillus sp. SN-8-1 TaxID=3435409 RepID=UPI003D9A392E